ncbi:hypothetical protein J1N35_001275 [Gossypium stocksii]|uniref:Uncharacterized protein n=1 Tax=Gossypium stocksii TaxID=47602 RepID=A0A9D3WHD6_9ROSI|nr:hypothetical protein J1N35_001275 [Gossypium stocksii]
MHLEKGFTLKESNYRDFMARIHQVAEALNWELFSEKRPSVDEELVREFYANLTSSKLTEGTINGWDLYRVAGDFVLQQQVEQSEDPEEEGDDPIEIKPDQLAEVPDKAEPMEPKAEPDIESSMFGAPPPSLDLRDGLSKLMDIMQHMQWQH